MVTRAGFPRNEGIRGAPPTSVVDGVTYHRILPDLDPADADRRPGPCGGRGRPRRLVERAPAGRPPAGLEPRQRPGRARAARPLRDPGRLRGARLPRGDVAIAGRRPMSPRATATARRARSRPPACATPTPSSPCPRRCAQDILDRGGTDPDRVVVVPNAVDVDRFVPGPRDPALAARLGIGDGPGHRLHLELHRLRGDPLPHRGDGRAARDAAAASAACSSATARSAAALEATATRPGVDDGTVIFTGRVPHDRDPRLLPAHRRVRRPAHERPRLAARHAAQAVRGDGDGARARRERGRGAARDRRTTARRVARSGPRTRSPSPMCSSRCSTIRPSASASVESARMWVAEHRTWRQNGARYRALYERLGVV